MDDDNSNLDEKELALLVQRFTIFFRKKKLFFKGVGKENLSSMSSKSIKIDYNSYQEYEKLNIGHLNKIKCFNYEKLGHVAVNYFQR